MRLLTSLPYFALLALAGCHEAPNVRSASDYDAPAAPPLRHPYYDPYAPYGQANATWTPDVVSRNGTIVKPLDPATSVGRPDYEHSQWATGAAGGSVDAPPGTF